MLRITIDVIPFGYKEQMKTLGIMEIINDGSGNIELGNYTVYINPDERGDKFRIEKFVRKRGFWELITEALLKKEEKDFEEFILNEEKRR